MVLLRWGVNSPYGGSKDVKLDEIMDEVGNDGGKPTVQYGTGRTGKEVTTLTTPMQDMAVQNVSDFVVASLIDGNITDYGKILDEDLMRMFYDIGDPRIVATKMTRMRDELLRRGLWRGVASSTRIWAFDVLKELASHYPSATSFSESEPDAYRAARLSGCLPNLYAIEKRPIQGRQTWTVKKITDAAKKCKTRTEFGRTYPGAYRAARSKGILDKVCPHMPTASRHTARSRTDQEIITSASRYGDASAFMRGDRSGYQQAVKRRLFSSIAKNNNWV